MFTVYLKSAGGTKKYFTEFETEAEAESFCREYGWEWVDENEFVYQTDKSTLCIWSICGYYTE